MSPLLLVTSLLLVISQVASTTHYYIVPFTSKALCHDYPDGTCYTLNSLYKVGEHFNGNITIGFLPGEHILTYTKRFEGEENSNLIMNNEKHAYSNLSSRIVCSSDSNNTGFNFINFNTLTIEGLEISGCKKQQSNGGAIFAMSVTNVFIRDCRFADNHVMGEDVLGARGGGAVCLENTVAASIQQSTFVNNSANCFKCDGGALYIDAKRPVVIDTCHFELNSASRSGGAVSYLVYAFFILSIESTSFVSNTVTSDVQVISGGAVSFNGPLSIVNCTFMNNSAGVGGAMHLHGTTGPQYVNIIGSRYINNKAKYGGAIYASYTGILQTNSSVYHNNSATSDGGAIYMFRGSLRSSANFYTENLSRKQGGGVDDFESAATFNGDYFSGNVARYGTAIAHELDLNLEIRNSTFTDNRHLLEGNGVVFVTQSLLKITGSVFFLNNHGSLYAFNSQVEFHGTVTFSNNTGDSGGAVTSITSVITLQTTSKTTITGNRASYGGGISLTQSTMNTFGTVLIANNFATISGAGIYAFQSVLDFRTEGTVIAHNVQQTNITNNLANGNGGGVYLIASILRISNGHVYIHGNTAEGNGGGMYVEQTSKIDLFKQKVELAINNFLFVRLEFSNNSARYGGAVYVSDSSNAGVLCNVTTYYFAQTNLGTQECFLQTLLISRDIPSPYIINTINTIFINNTATASGKDIYGGLLDRCTISPLAELLRLKPEFRFSNGLVYLQQTALFQEISTPTTDLSQHISSGAVRVCFCRKNIIDCNYTQPTVFVKKGESFTLSVAAVDQVERSVKALVFSSYLSVNGGIGRLKEGQENRPTTNQCTELEYNIYSTGNSSKLQLYAGGPCSNQGVSKQKVNVTFLPCNCPIGFQQSSSQIACDCICDKRLTSYVSHCSSENETIQVDANVWIKDSNSSNHSGFTVQYCPFDYCVDKPVHIQLSNPNTQCAFNRTGNLCGECEDGLSLVFASSHCEECSDYFLLLLMPFALAGVLLVALILLLNLTVATGTINGLIFYANILAANRSIFLPFNVPSLLTIFISWLNLDLGIKACFYNGMNSYGKLLLQLVFPTYLFLLIGIIIVLCNHSQKVSALLGKRNPVAALSTLILLSYSKLLRTIIASLQFTTLDFPDGSREYVWLHDANVAYLSVGHIPRFVTAFVVVAMGSIYTVLLFFGQWFHLCSNWKLMKWVRKPQYNAFIEAYHAPLTPRHRYWIGLLLLVRLVHSLISAFTSDSITVLSTGVIVFGLMLLKVLNTKTYKNWLLDTIETSFLLNLGLLSISTLYELPSKKSNQVAIANASMGIALITFIGIVLYHLCTYILKSKWDTAWRKIKEWCQSVKQYLVSSPEQEMLNVLEEGSDQEPVDDVEHYQEQEQVYTDNNTRPDDLPEDYEPPHITYCVPDDELREPLLDDYQDAVHLVPLPSRVHKPVQVTHSLVIVNHD